MAVYSGGGAPTQLPLQGAALSLPPPALRLPQTPGPKCSRSEGSGSLNLAGGFALMRPPCRVAFCSVAILHKRPSRLLGSTGPTFYIKPAVGLPDSNL